MNDQSLEEILRAAGRSAAGRPGSRADLADRVRRLSARRIRTRRATVGTTVAVLLIAAVAAVLWPAGNSTHTAGNSPVDPSTRDQDVQAPAPPDIEQLRAEIARLDAEARRHSRNAEEIIQQIRLRQAAADRHEVPVLSAEDLARVEIEKTAFLLVDHADQRALAAPGISVESDYRRVIELFPDTKAARKAREILNVFPIERGDL